MLHMYCKPTSKDIEIATEDLAKRKKAAIFSAKLMGKLEEDSIPAIISSKIS
ncbi:hypothetical protein [Thermococcus aggregans]|uniref:hypothetical protein n=1 Tax=Thermococcus aggregans TaxID=110163 RepID=UPI00344E7C4D